MKIAWLGLSNNVQSIGTIDAVITRLGKTLHWYEKEKDLRNALVNTEGAVLFLHVEHDSIPYELCLELAFTYPLVSIILITPEDGFDLKKAMRVGATDVIRMPVQESEVEQSIRDAENTVRLKLSKSNGTTRKIEKNTGRVITVFSTKGGVGKTTVTVNLAAAFSKQNLKVAVIDLDLQFGDVAILYDIQPKRTIYEWVKEEHGDSERILDRYIHSHASGVNILAAPHRPEFAEEVTGQHIAAVIEELKQTYDILLIDTPPSFVETGLVALENSTDILVVTTLDLPTLKNCKLCIETLESLGLKDRIKVIVNRNAKVEGIQPETVENVFGMPIYTLIPDESQMVLTSINRGTPFVLSNPGGKAAESVLSLASRLHANSDQNQNYDTKKSLFDRMLKR